MPVTSMEGMVRLVRDNGEYVVIHFNGVPPFTTVVIDDNGTVSGYTGHGGLAALTGSEDESDQSHSSRPH